MALQTSRRLALALVTLLTALFALTAPAAVAVAPAGGVTAQQVEDDEFFDVSEEPVLEDEEEDFFVDDELSEDEPTDADLAQEDSEEQPVDEEVAALEQATAELGRAKRSVAGKLARLSASSAALRPCLRGGPGWKRIRAIDHASQRSLYTAAARRLLADMRLLLDGQQPRIVVYDSAFTGFVAELRAAPISDPLLSEAVAAQGRRLAAYRDVRRVSASCAVFNKLTKRVREFPTRSAAQIVRADYRSAPIARRIERHISKQLAAIDRRHGISHRDAETLADAAALMVDRGGEPGYATGFQYALSLR